jgi:hypothetical protein
MNRVSGRSRIGYGLGVCALVAAVAAPTLPAVACSPRTAASLGLAPGSLPVVDPAPPEAPATEPSVPIEPSAPMEPAPTRPSCRYVRRIEFPVVANGVFLSSFGVPREGGARWHHGVDIAAPTMTPVVAAADGEVSSINSNPDNCCWVAIKHTDGWTSMYVHLTNDTPGTDDGAWVGIRPDLQEGDAVTAGELIGWVGDSGNAEPGEPHLHFELRTPSGEPIDPYPSLRAAFGRTPRALALPDGELVGQADGVIVTGRPEFTGPFIDDDDVAGSEPLFNALLLAGAPAWCDRWGLRACPGRPASGADARGWISVLGGAVTGAVAYGETEIVALDQQGVAPLCGRATLCADQPVTWAEVAALMLGASDGRTHQPAEAFAAIDHQLSSCGSPLDPLANPSRLELAGSLLRYFGQVGDLSCVNFS